MIYFGQQLICPSIFLNEKQLFIIHWNWTCQICLRQMCGSRNTVNQGVHALFERLGSKTHFVTSYLYKWRHHLATGTQALSCLEQLPFCVNVLPQTLQVNGFSLVWVRRCSISLMWYLNWRKQKLHVWISPDSLPPLIKPRDKRFNKYEGTYKLQTK